MLYPRVTTAVSGALVALALIGCGPRTDSPLPPKGMIDLIHFDAHLRLSAASEEALSIRGQVTITARAREGLSLELDGVGFADFEATSSPPATWRYNGERILGKWPTPITGDITVRITWQAKPGLGLVRSESAAWTVFHTWRWMPVRSDPSERATLSLKVEAPDGWTVIATGDGPDQPGPDVASRIPHPSYTYGFFAGRIHGFRSTDRLDVWGASDLAATQVIERSQAALDRWTARFGTPWSIDRYVQVFVPGRAAQELAGMAFLSESYLDELEKNPDEDWLIVHELAHQAWGNIVTCATWGDFWLNEALVVWWVARDKQLRGQQKGYERELDLWSERVEKATRKGEDRRIARPGVGYEDADGGMVYSAGALIVHRLAQAVGVEVFEASMRQWIQDGRNRGISLSTAQFLASLGLTSDQLAGAKCRLAGGGQECLEL